MTGATSDNQQHPISATDVVRALGRAARKAAATSLLSKSAARHRARAAKAAETGSAGMWMFSQVSKGTCKVI